MHSHTCPECHRSWVCDSPGGCRPVRLANGEPFLAALEDVVCPDCSEVAQPRGAREPLDAPGCYRWPAAEGCA